MGSSSKFIIDFFAQRTTAPICIVSYANLREEAKLFPPREIYTRDAGEIDRFVKDNDKPGRAVYFGVNPVIEGKRRNKQNVAEIAAAHADLDFKHIIENRREIEMTLRQLMLQPSCIVFSGNGLHPYWWIHATVDQGDRVEAMLKQLCWAFAGDPAVCEIARVMRLPGSHNTKNGERHNVKVLSKQDTVYTLEQLEDWLGVLEEPYLHRIGEEAKTNGKGGGNVWEQLGDRQSYKAPIDIDSMWNDLQYLGSGGGGNLHETELRIVASLLSRGEAVETVIAYLREQIKLRIPESSTWDWGTSKGGEVHTIREQCV